MPARSRQLTLGVLLALAGAALACGAVREPVRSPLAEPPATATAAPTPSAPPPLVTTTPLPRGGAPAAPEVEPAVARATALLAEWLALPARELTLVSADPVVWPSACLGVQRPGDVCAAVRTPGFRVRLRDGLGGLHTVHAAADGGNARWAGEVHARGVLATLDRVELRATVVQAGSEPVLLRLVPGTLLPPGLRPGAPVEVAYDPPGNGEALPVAAWLVPAS